MSGVPRSAGRSPRRRWVRRLRAASIVALACLGLAALDSTGTWRITSYFTDPTFAEVEGQTAARSAPPADQAHMHALVVEPGPPPNQSVDGSQPMSRQAAVAQSAEPATVETSAAATPQPSPLAGAGAAHRRHHTKSTRSAHGHKGLEPPRALGFAEADPYRQRRGWNWFGRSAGFGFFQ
jgi:hypothetical protein